MNRKEQPRDRQPAHLPAGQPAQGRPRTPQRDGQQDQRGERQPVGRNNQRMRFTLRETNQDRS